MIRECTNCVNCESVRGFMVTCHCSYDEMRDGILWHVQSGRDCHKSYARKCEENYREVGYTDEMIQAYKEMHKRFLKLKEFEFEN